MMSNDIIEINHFYYGETTVKVVRETAKAILLAGNASQAWFPKSAIDGDNTVADWFSLSLEHFFLFDVPYKEVS
jgi:L-asparaginase II|tara:strand:- start:334 stop:555 length:222 start_codon:yes stop_codon:yes gene_type:complete